MESPYVDCYGCLSFFQEQLAHSVRNPGAERCNPFGIICGESLLHLEEIKTLRQRTQRVGPIKITGRVEQIRRQRRPLRDRQGHVR